MLITIKTYRDNIDANLDKGYLESQGIKCYLKNEETVAANWLYSQAVGGVELQVEEGLADQAKLYLDNPSP